MYREVTILNGEMWKQSKNEKELIILILGCITRPVEHGYGISIGCVSHCLSEDVNDRNGSCVSIWKRLSNLLRLLFRMWTDWIPMGC